MRFAYALVLVMVLVASTAFASEKIAEPQNALPTLGSRGVITGTLDEASPIWDRGYAGNPFVGDCSYLLTDSSSDGQSLNFHCIEVLDRTPIEVVVDHELTQLEDTTLYIYCDPFDPALPMDNVNFFDDDGAEGYYSAIVADDAVILEPGVTYWLVLSTFSAGDLGDYTMATSDNLMLCGSVATESVDWGSLKAQYK